MCTFFSLFCLFLCLGDLIMHKKKLVNVFTPLQDEYSIIQIHFGSSSIVAIVVPCNVAFLRIRYLMNVKNMRKNHQQCCVTLLREFKN